MKKEKPQKRQDYFARAQSWADDVYGAATRSRNRYKAAFLGATGLNVASILAVAVLANTQTLVPMVVHHYDNGVVTVEALANEAMPINRAQVESDILRYVTNRESYAAQSYRAQFDLVSLLSDEGVLKEYAREQESAQKNAPINRLGTKAYREIHVYSINFLDNLVLNNKDIPKNHQNLAEVVFTLTDIDRASGTRETEHFNALVSWQYKKPSDSPEIRWKNWDGFEVTRYAKQARNVEKETV